MNLEEEVEREILDGSYPLLFTIAAKEGIHPLVEEILRLSKELEGKGVVLSTTIARPQRTSKRHSVRTLCTIALGNHSEKMMVSDISLTGMKGRVMQTFLEKFVSGSVYVVTLKTTGTSSTEKTSFDLYGRLVRISQDLGVPSVSFQFVNLTIEQEKLLKHFIEAHTSESAKQ